MWRRFRSWSAKVQAAIGVVAAVLLIGAVAPDPDEGRTVAATSTAGPVEDVLPMAPTAAAPISTIAVTSSTAAPTTTPAPTTTTAAPTTTAPPPPPTAVAPRRAVAPASTCHPSYDPCLPITDDLDCGDIGQTVRVLGADDYRLDRDGDGLGCES